MIMLLPQQNPTGSEVPGPPVSQPTMEEAGKIIVDATEAAVKVHADFEKFCQTENSIVFTKNLMTLFGNAKDATTFYTEYSKECLRASEHFGISQKYASLLMIKVFDAIVKSNERQSYDEAPTTEDITEREEGTIRNLQLRPKIA